MATKPTVLIIDDDERTHHLLKDMFMALDIELHHALDSQNGLTLAEEIQPNLILMDLRLPAPSLAGWEMVAYLKGNKGLAHIPIVIMSASGGEHIMRAMKAGADDFIEKPFSVRPLMRKVVHIIGLAKT